MWPHFTAALVAIAVLGRVELQAQPTLCAGDCTEDGRVDVDELIRSVAVALGQRPSADCGAADVDGDGNVSIVELVLVVEATLRGCTASFPTATPGETPRSTLTPAATQPMPTATLAHTPTATPSPGSGFGRPNFIVINLDDTRFDGLDRMPVVLSRLAGDGVTFRNAFVAASSCAPSRASLLSGRYAMHHGTRGITGPIGGADTFRVGRADRQTIAVWLRNSGYRTALFGKYLNDYADTEANRGPGGTFYVPPGWDRWRAMRSPEHYGGIHGPTYTLVDEHGELTDYDDHLTDAQYSTDLLASELRAFIIEAATAGQPFFALWAPYASHGDTPDFQPKPADRHRGIFAGLPLWRPPSWNETDVSDKPLWVGSLPVSPVLAAVTDVARERAYETLLAVDEQIGLLLDLLEQLGLDRNTVILLTSDNGVCWGEHRYFGQGKGCPYEECLRVPMLIRYPRLVTGARVAEAPVLNIDVAPTLAALAGVVVPVAIDGASFAPLLVGPAPATWRTAFLLEHWDVGRGDAFVYTGQVSDGDRLRLLHGDWRPGPRAALVLEFDGGDGVVTAGAVPVPIGSDAASSFANLGAAVAAHVPGSAWSLDPQRGWLAVTSPVPPYTGLYWIVEMDQGGVIERLYPLPDFHGVRDVAGGYTYVEYETGEVELYDLNADPFQMENKAEDGAYSAVRAALAGNLSALLGE